MIFYSCTGMDENCSRKNCHRTGGKCEHTTDPAFARKTEDVRIFEEYEPGCLFEIDPDKVSKSDTPGFLRRLFHDKDK